MKKILVIISALLVLSFTSDKTFDITVKGNSEFAFDLFKKLTEEKKDQNLFFSPFSISSALAMTYGGARGTTQDSMAKALHFTESQDSLHAHFSELLHRLNSSQKGTEVSIANSLWIDKSLPLRKEYFEMVQSKYNAEAQNVDFLNDEEREKTRLRINGWVEDKTNKKIQDLLAPEMLTADTRLVLVNAIYFLGKWANPFESALTEAGLFHVDLTQKTNARFMNSVSRLNYFEDQKMQAIELPYIDNKVSMVIVLPKEAEGIKELDKTFTYAKYLQISQLMHSQKVYLWLPKFKMTCNFVLNEPLSKLGMANAFGGSADFSGLTTREDLHISAVIHKAFIDVSEQGTEAAAATAVIMETKSEEKKIYFKANHPFLFYIKDNATGSILFFGKVMNPAL